MIIGHLTYETTSLLACSLTCYSWHIATIPHLHHTLILTTYDDYTDKKFVWPQPLRNMRKFGLLPLVKKFQVHGKNHCADGFSPRLFNCHILRHFSALTNVQELGIDYLNTLKFMSRVRRYFGHFSLTVRSLALREPKGSRRQIIYFIGLFQHLEDLKLLYDRSDPQEEPVNDLRLIPPFAPSLDGQLTMTSFTRVELLKDMIDLFGGLRFRYMDLCNVDGMRLLLDTCAKTLETLRLHPADPRGEGFPLEDVRVPANAFVAGTSFQDFDLSRNKSLRTLEIPVSHSYHKGPGLLTRALSTITSPVPPKVVIVYRDHDFHGLQHGWYGQKWDLRPGRLLPWAWHDTRNEILSPWMDFRIFHEMHEIRNFQLELRADVWGGVAEYAVQILRRAVAMEKAEKAQWEFGNIFLEPLVSCRPRVFHREYTSESYTAGFPEPWIPL